MNAHVLRERSLAKNRIFQLLPVLTLLVSWCQCFNVVTPSSVLSSNMLNTSDKPTYSHRFGDDRIAPKTINNHEYLMQNVPKQESSQKLTDYQNTNGNRMELNVQQISNEQKPVTIRKHYKPNTRQFQIDQHEDNKTASDFIARCFLRKRKWNATQNRLFFQLRMKRTRGELHRYNLHQRLGGMLPKIFNNNDSHIYRTNLIFNLNTDSNSNRENEINAIERRNAFNQQKKTMEQTTTTTTITTSFSMNRMHLNQVFNHHDEGRGQHRIERNRRESTSEVKLAGTLSRHSPFSYSRINGQSFGNGNALRPRRFCTARDPTTLAFEAPTVFEGKVRSMSSDRRRNFSVTFEVKEIYKRQMGLKLPALVRLKFTYKNSSECDIYRETFRPIGHVRDELDPGKLYVLFVNQIDLSNFTILGQPVKLTRKTVKDVRTGVAEKYGKFILY